VKEDTMKITKAHFEHMESEIQKACKKNKTTVKEIVGLYSNMNLSQKRAMWDILRGAGLIPWICSTLYPYLNDDHIDTALRKIARQN
jgi:GH24 family phage-related lysozyme (muramidase)